MAGGGDGGWWREGRKGRRDCGESRVLVESLFSGGGGGGRGVSPAWFRSGKPSHTLYSSRGETAGTAKEEEEEEE